MALKREEQNKRGLQTDKTKQSGEVNRMQVGKRKRKEEKTYNKKVCNEDKKQKISNLKSNLYFVLGSS